MDAAAVSRDTVWLGTGRGLSLTATAGASWAHFANTGTFDGKGVAAIALNDEAIWVSIGYSETRDGNSIPVGGGLHYSTNRGQSWTYIPQPADQGTVDTITYGINKIPALAITVPQQNITYDIGLTTTSVWIASFAGMLRKSTDRGQTWSRVVLPPDGLNSISPNDTLDFDLSPSVGALNLRENLNHRVFSVYAPDDTTIWVGTAGGINRSTDGGISWRKFSHQNQTQPISGNFVVALNEQRWLSRRILWAATVNALDPDEKQGVSSSEDGGSTWKISLLGERPHNISFRDSLVYIATDRGLYRSSDFGATWVRSGTIIDRTTGQRFVSTPIYTVATRGDTVWAGGPEGTAYTVDNPSLPFGYVWRVFRAYQPVNNERRTYSYPSPFSPDDEPVRIHFSTFGTTREVTIRIFDFAMNHVKTLLQNATRSGSNEHDEIWDGRDEQERRVTNGVYFYRIELEGEEAIWGKIFVIQ